MNVSNQAYDLQEKHEDCLECGEAIFNPICPNCIAYEFEQWISKYPQLESPVSKIINKFLREHEKLNQSSRECILCGNKSAYLCPYCFTEFLLNVLKVVRADKKALAEFLQLFNYDFDHTGYYLEGEELGAF